MRARVLGGLGAFATLVTVAILARPGLADALPGVAQLLESQDPERLLLVLGAVVATYAAWSARAGSPERRPTEGPSARFARVGDPPEAVSATDRIRTGESFDARVEAACSGDDEALGAVQSTLTDAAASARVRTHDCTPAEAQHAVQTGAWTDDRLAAAFLAGDDGPGFPLWTRLRAWLDPETEQRRRVERTVRAVRRTIDRDGIGDVGTTSDAEGGGR